MKFPKKLFALASLSFLNLGTALAQQNTDITVYGRANVSGESQKVGSKSELVLVDNSSRLGIRAEHKLPEGMSVGATLEAGTNFTNGKTHGFFAREATARLSTANMGTIKVGQLAASTAYFATADYVSNHNHDTGTSSDALYDTPAVGNLKNAVSYTAPKINGLQLEAQYGLKYATGVGGTDQNSFNPMSLSANYDMGPLALGVGYERGQNERASSTKDYVSQIALRAFYTQGPWGYGGYLQKSSGTNYDRTAYRLAAMYTQGQSEYHVNLGMAGNRNGVANTGATQMTLAYNYNLDKQTKLYAFYTSVNNKSAASYHPDRFYTSPTAGQDLSALGAGLRYNF